MTEITNKDGIPIRVGQVWKSNIGGEHYVVGFSKGGSRIAVEYSGSLEHYVGASSVVFHTLIHDLTPLRPAPIEHLKHRMAEVIGMLSDDIKRSNKAQKSIVAILELMVERVGLIESAISTEATENDQ